MILKSINKNFFKNLSKIKLLKKDNKNLKFLEITTLIGCANNCAYCPQKSFIKSYFKKNPKRQSILTFEDFKIVLKNTSKEYCINFGGFSEAFLNPSTIDMILYANNNGYKIRVNTTLRGIALEQLEKIKHIKYEMFNVHTPDEDNILMLDVDDKYIEKINFVKNFYNVEFMVIGRVNSKIDKLLNGNIRKSKIYLRGNSLNNEKFPATIEFEKLNFQPIPENKRIYCSRAMKDNLQQLTWPVMLPDGSVVLCCMDWTLKHVLGNIYEDNLDSILKNKLIKRIKKSMLCKNNDKILCRECEKAIIY